MVVVIAVLSVVIRDRDLFRSCLCPAEADPPSVVDPDAVLTSSIAAQLLEPGPARDTEIT
jgi:hypothetical protein